MLVYRDQYLYRSLKTTKIASYVQKFKKVNTEVRY